MYMLSLFELPYITFKRSCSPYSNHPHYKPKACLPLVSYDVCFTTGLERATLSVVYIRFIGRRNDEGHHRLEHNVRGHGGTLCYKGNLCRTSNRYGGNVSGNVYVQRHNSAFSLLDSGNAWIWLAQWYHFIFIST